MLINIMDMKTLECILFIFEILFKLPCRMYSHKNKTSKRILNIYPDISLDYETLRHNVIRLDFSNYFSIIQFFTSLY